jgi:hypothetical protein
MAVLLLDGDLRILALNGWAERMLAAPEAQLVGRRPGDALHCVAALGAPNGCGHGADCEGCLVRASALEAVRGSTVSQREVRVVSRAAGKEEERILLLSASPFLSDGREMVVVLLQDVTVLHRLRGLVPICAGCKKIRRDDKAWEALEVFIEQHSHAEFTHGLCPDCLSRFYPDYTPAK